MFFSLANSFEPSLSAINTDTSSCEKPAAWSRSTAVSAALREGKMPNAAVFLPAMTLSLYVEL